MEAGRGPRVCVAGWGRKRRHTTRRFRGSAGRHGRLFGGLDPASAGARTARESGHAQGPASGRDPAEPGAIPVARRRGRLTRTRDATPDPERAAPSRTGRRAIPALAGRVHGTNDTHRPPPRSGRTTATRGSDLGGPIATSLSMYFEFAKRKGCAQESARAVSLETAHGSVTRPVLSRLDLARPAATATRGRHDDHAS